MREPLRELYAAISEWQERYGWDGRVIVGYIDGQAGGVVDVLLARPKSPPEPAEGAWHSLAVLRERGGVKKVLSALWPDCPKEVLSMASLAVSMASKLLPSGAR